MIHLQSETATVVAWIIIKEIGIVATTVVSVYSITINLEYLVVFNARFKRKILEPKQQTRVVILNLQGDNFSPPLTQQSQVQAETSITQEIKKSAYLLR